MRTRPIFIAALIIATITLSAQTTGRGNTNVRFDNQSIDEMVAEFMRDHDVSGLSLAIVQAPYITRATGFGFADRQTRTLVSANTAFDIAEMRNAYTAVAAMQLVEDRKVELQTVLGLIRNPRKYAELETLIEKASGRTYQQFIRERQFEPLGLRHTFFASELGSVAHEMLQQGERHRKFLRERVFIDPTEPATGEGDAPKPRSHPTAIYSSASDISVWDIALAGEILVKDPALRKLLYEPEFRADGVRIPTSGPWVFPGHAGLMVSTGSGNGFSSLLSRFTHRDELVCVTLLANREGLDLTQLARKIAGAHNAKLGPPHRAAGTRVQQSPYGVNETIDRLRQILTDRGVTVTSVDLNAGIVVADFGRASIWEEGGEVWISVPDTRTLRREIDALLLETVGPEDK